MLNQYTTYILPPRALYSPYWQSVNAAYGAAILDRTDTVDFGFKYKTLTPIPELTQYSETFAQTCEKTGWELVNKADQNDCSINLMWSGGIDSTVALISIIKTGKTERLRVLLSPASVEEYPLFFNTFIKDNLQYSLTDNPKAEMRIQDINVTGEIGDQLFGSAAILKAYDSGKLFSPYAEYMHKGFLRKLESQIAKCPVELTTTFDFLWWFNFSMKYQNVQLRLYPSVQIPYGKITHFFDTTDFQLWSLNNPDKKIKSTPESYKFTAKDYIYEFTKDADYRDNKLKIGSLQLGGVPYCITEDFKCLKVSNYATAV